MSGGKSWSAVRSIKKKIRRWRSCVPGLFWVLVGVRGRVRVGVRVRVSVGVRARVRVRVGVRVGVGVRVKLTRLGSRSGLG